jgi:hypothetical protein
MYILCVEHVHVEIYLCLHVALHNFVHVSTYPHMYINVLYASNAHWNLPGHWGSPGRPPVGPPVGRPVIKISTYSI